MTPGGRLTPADAVVVEVLAALGAEHLDHHAVEMQALHQHPGEGAQEEEVQEHRHHLTRQLQESQRDKGQQQQQQQQ